MFSDEFCRFVIHGNGAMNQLGNARSVLVLVLVLVLAIATVCSTKFDGFWVLVMIVHGELRNTK